MSVVEQPGFRILVLPLEAQRQLNVACVVALDPSPGLVARRPDGLARFVE